MFFICFTRNNVRSTISFFSDWWSFLIYYNQTANFSYYRWNKERKSRNILEFVVILSFIMYSKELLFPELKYTGCKVWKSDMHLRKLKIQGYSKSIGSCTTELQTLLSLVKLKATFMLLRRTEKSHLTGMLRCRITEQVWKADPVSYYLLAGSKEKKNHYPDELKYVVTR